MTDWRAVAAIVLLASVCIAALSLSQPEGPAEPEAAEADSMHITIGVVSASQNEYPVNEYLLELAERDVSEYCSSTGVEWSFGYIHESAEGSASTAMKLTEGFKEGGVNLLLGYPWSSFLCSGAMGYVTENDMLIVSTASTSPLMAIEDNVYRLTAHDWAQGQVIAAVLDDLGIEAVVAIERGDAWAEGITSTLAELYPGEMVQIEYPGETEIFAEYLDDVQSHIDRMTGQYGSSHVAVLLVSFSEAATVLHEAADYPTLLNVAWLGTDASVDDERITEIAPEEAVKVRLIGPRQGVVKSELFQRVNGEYSERYPAGLGLYTGNVYDGYWLLALSVIETGSTGGDAVAAVLPAVAETYRGVTGPFTFDAYGDRVTALWELYGYFAASEGCSSRVCGEYNATTGEIEWYMESPQ
ncbi:ABC transporter substrate-binding protein [Candidatus Bathyarchaeota archaeon]|nr:ABC transporter substrate-binding protein [Candidatus Bathyarchaeota archaeon]